MDENTGILYQKITDSIGTHEDVYVEEYAAELLGATDEDMVRLTEKVIKEDLEKAEDLRDFSRFSVNFDNVGVVKEPVLQNSWVDFILSPDSVWK